jgi:phenylpyruvate tautomerase PptA (4-oxalocrotonate tautomerase family)
VIVAAPEPLAIADAIYDALREHLEVPDHDRFQITLSEGRSVDMKKAFYKAVTEGLRNSAGVRPEAVMINLVEVRKENCSFGNGIAQYT